MLPLDELRKNPEKIKIALSKKKFQVDIDKFLEVDTLYRAALANFEDLRARQNEYNGKISSLPKGSNEFIQAISEMKKLAADVKSADTEAKKIEEKWRELYLSIPNIPHESVPVGRSDKDNVTIATYGDIENVSPYAMPHYDIPWFTKAIDFPRGVKVTGAGFPFYVGDMARLVRALLAFFLDEARDNGYTEFMCPIVVNELRITKKG